MKAEHQFKTFENIRSLYKGDVPLHLFLNAFFKKNKQMGSRDRKIASRLIYNFFRIGGLYNQLEVLNRLCIAEFLCNQQTNSFLDYFKPHWANKIHVSVEEKFKILFNECGIFDLKSLFPFSSHLSNDIHQDLFLKSFLYQPNLFIRIKRNHKQEIIEKLKSVNVEYNLVDDFTISFPNGTSLEKILQNSNFYEVQDYSSQLTSLFFKPQKWDKWWDCCAASGGKSLALIDEEPNIKLLVSDNRETILKNLEERFRNSGVKNFQSKILDLTLSPEPYIHNYEFDGIIFDAPCSGSGTWGRTPEMITYFNEYKIDFFQQLQRTIAKNIIPYLKVGKPLIYITCSVFKEENEAQTLWLTNNFPLEIESQKLILGSGYKADSMFVSRLIKLPKTK